MTFLTSSAGMELELGESWKGWQWAETRTLNVVQIRIYRRHGCA
jgi:hypothetical protein